jgi:hypothetical protein
MGKRDMHCPIEWLGSRRHKGRRLLQMRLVNLRHQYGTALAVAADHINQELHIACDKAIANREKPFATRFTAGCDQRVPAEYAVLA